MTTGQRVSQKRKELGLSQEALGEKLGVSRQSIYKWESDSALPEVEKLVALSRLFGVSVGWLLGVEEEAAPSSGGELTAEQLRLVEEIAARYAPKPHLSSRKMTAVKRFAAAAAVCLCLILWSFNRRLEDLTQNYTHLQYAISEVETGVNSQIGGVSNRVEELLREQNAVTADYGTTLAGADPSASQAFFQAYAVPKNFVEGMTAEFYTVSGGRQNPAVRAEQGAGQRFTAELRCGLAEDISVSVAFVYPDETRQTQVLKRYDGLYGQTFPAVRADYGLCYKPVENGTFSLAETERECGRLDWNPDGFPENSLAKADLKSLRVGLFKNQKLVDWAVFDPAPGVFAEKTTVLTEEQWKDLDSLLVNYGGGNKAEQWLTFKFPPQEVPVEAGDVFQIAAVMEDVYGRTAVRSSGAFGLDEGWKELTNLDADTSDTYPGGWMLEDGSSICS